MEITRDKALALLTEYTQGSSLIKHAYAVEGSMLWYADHFNIPENEKLLWGVTGLLHDFDYERYPDPTPPDGHPFHGNRILGELGYPDSIRTAIMGHALYSGVPRESLMAKTLFAVDELSGFVTACTLVRPDKSLGALEIKSVRKKMKDKAFARGCNRDDIILGAEELGIELDVHIDNVRNALIQIADRLELNP